MTFIVGHLAKELFRCLFSLLSSFVSIVLGFLMTLNVRSLVDF